MKSIDDCISKLAFSARSHLTSPAVPAQELNELIPMGSATKPIDPKEHPGRTYLMLQHKQDYGTCETCPYSYGQRDGDWEITRMCVNPEVAKNVEQIMKSAGSIPVPTEGEYIFVLSSGLVTFDEAQLLSKSPDMFPKYKC